MTTATIHAFRTRTKPQLLVEAPVDTRTPLMKRLDDIQARSERPRVQAVGTPRIDSDPKYWRRAYNGFLWNHLEEVRCKKR